MDCVFGLARDARLQRALGAELHEAVESRSTGRAARRFKALIYPCNSASRSRHVVGKAEHTGDKSNLRFVVTSLSAKQWDARAFYEHLQCARGAMAY